MTASRTTRRRSTCRRSTVLPGLIDVHTHLVGDVQTAGVPSTTTSAAQEVLIGVRHARQTIEAGFTTVRDVGSFRAFADCALRDAIEAGRRARAADAVRRRVHHRAVGWRRRRRPGPRHRAARGPAVRGRSLGRRGPRAGPTPADRRRRPHQVHRHGRGADPRRRPRRARAQRGRAARRGRGGRLVRRVRRRPRARCGGREAGDPGRRPHDRARLVPRRRGDLDARRHRHVLQRRPVRRGVGARARRPRGLAGGDDAQAGRVAGRRRGRPAPGGRPWRPDRVRHRQRGLPARPQCAEFRLVHPLRDVAARRDPDRDDGRRRGDGLVGSGRLAGGRAVRRSRGGRGRSARRPDGAGAADGRGQGRPAGVRSAAEARA